MTSEIYSSSLIFLSSNSFRQSSPVGDPKMRNSSFVFIFNFGHIFQNCVKIELYCVLVVGPKKQFFRSNFFGFHFPEPFFPKFKPPFKRIIIGSIHMLQTKDFAQGIFCPKIRRLEILN